MNSSSPLSAHWRSSKASTTGSVAAIRSKNRRQPLNRSARSLAVRCSRPEQVRKPWFDETALTLVRHVLLDGGSEFVPRGCDILLLHDAGARPHHVGERPVGHSVPV